MPKIVNIFKITGIFVGISLHVAYGMGSEGPFIPSGQAPRVELPPLGRTQVSQEQASSSSSSSSTQRLQAAPASSAKIYIRRGPEASSHPGEVANFNQRLEEGAIIQLPGISYVEGITRDTPQADVGHLDVHGANLSGPQMERLIQILEKAYPNLESINFTGNNIVSNDAFRALAESALASRLKRLGFVGGLPKLAAFNAANLNRFTALENLSLYSPDFNNNYFNALADSDLAARLRSLSATGDISSASFNAQTLAKFKALKKLMLKSELLNGWDAEELDSLVKELRDTYGPSQLEELILMAVRGKPARTSQLLSRNR